MVDEATQQTGFKGLIAKYASFSLIARIAIGLAIGAVLGVLVPQATGFALLGTIFVGALKAIAPILVFVLVIAALIQNSARIDRRFGLVILLYIVGTLLASFVAVAGSYLFPQMIPMAQAEEAATIPGSIVDVLSNLLTNAVANPLASIVNANYIGILLWAAIIGVALKGLAAPTTKTFFLDVSSAVTKVVGWIIQFAPFGILGLVFSAVSENGLEIFTTYGSLILLLVVCMLIVALVVHPIMVALTLKRNPYPLVLRCLRESGITAFFTRSSAANIPVNMRLCERLRLDKDMYSVSIPLGATINMSGAAVTIAIMTLATVYSQGNGMPDIPSALILCVLATLGACGASGVAGGSLLLIPMACSLFGIGNDIAMQAVGVGFIIGVIQDSMETALNSSSDALFTATADYRQNQNSGKPLPKFLGGTMETDV